MCVCVCVCVCVCMHMHTCAHVCWYGHACVHVCVWMGACMCVHECMRACVFAMYGEVCQQPESASAAAGPTTDSASHCVHDDDGDDIDDNEDHDDNSGYNWDVAGVLILQPDIAAVYRTRSVARLHHDGDEEDDDSGDSDDGATRGVRVSMSAFLACHQCYCVGSSLAWGLNLRAVVCGIF